MRWVLEDFHTVRGRPLLLKVAGLVINTLVLCGGKAVRCRWHAGRNADDFRHRRLDVSNHLV